ncbi:MAG: mechanosensitive ion channel family protein [Candidatus Rokuibacteriota bacterium]
MPPKELIIDLAIRYGFQVLGALVIVGVGFVAAWWVSNLTERPLRRLGMEPPLQRLIIRVVRILVLLLALVIALDKFGFQIAPLVAGIGVAGLGIGIALQGVLTKPSAWASTLVTTRASWILAGWRPASQHGGSGGVRPEGPGADSARDGKNFSHSAAFETAESMTNAQCPGRIRAQCISRPKVSA